MPLTVAAHTGQSEVVKILLEKGATLEAPKQDGSTPFFASVQEGKADCVRILLAAGASPKTPRHDGITPLIIAAYTGNLELTQLLVEECGVDVNTTSNHGSALTLAQSQGHPHVADYLRSKGATAPASGQMPQFQAGMAMHQAAQAQLQNIMAMFAQMQAAQ